MKGVFLDFSGKKYYACPLIWSWRRLKERTMDSISQVMSLACPRRSQRVPVSSWLRGADAVSAGLWDTGKPGQIHSLPDTQNCQAKDRKSSG